MHHHSATHWARHSMACCITMLLALTGTGMSLAASSFLPQEYVSQSLELHICDKKMVNDLGSASGIGTFLQHCCT